MNKIFIKMLCLVCILFAFPAIGQAEEQGEEPLVQLAILLDTSGSMEGLIEQAKTQLWNIVNEMARSKRDGKTISLYVALYEYGKSSIPSEQGYIRMIAPLTTDLDKISEELFILRTNGGDEYCGQVIQSAAKELDWSENNDDLKIIFIAGNEPFTQGKVDYRKSCKNTISKGIIVNTIFCGDHLEGIRTNWKDGADLADGKYMNIDQNIETVHIEAPQDDEIILLGEELNKTYIAYGSAGEKSKFLQEEMDTAAGSVSSGMLAQRTITKSSTQYKNAYWDLVDAEAGGTISIEELKEEELPEEMKNMTNEERKEYIDEKAKERKEIQKRINELNEERRKYVAEHRSKMSENTLDAVIIKTIQEQANKKSYTFE